MRVASSPLAASNRTVERYATLAVDAPLPWLAGLSAAQFMKRYWQRRPLLVRNALPEFVDRFDPQTLCQLACDDDVEARLISQRRKRWQVESGPFEPERFDALPARDWTVLVQGVNLHDEVADALLDRFRFVPSARLDDVMISVAAPGGGVGPHFDSYDVFLLQTKGRRRWRIGAQQDLTLRDGVPLKLLANFVAEEEYVLEPGDMLYLPPKYAHDGVALDNCVTCSIGFRAPSLQELQVQCLFRLGDRLSDAEPALYRDAGAPATTSPGRVPERMASQLRAAMRKLRFDEPLLAETLGVYLSEPKATTFFDSPDRPAPLARFVLHASQVGIRADRKSILLYDERHFFINGEALALDESTRHAWQTLANSRQLEPTLFVTLANQTSIVQQIYGWYRAGWIGFA
ncbi:cupin domain-containing protein [Chitinasiproducens palmae]|uniref:50S ribosomal protein L16 3-hydroxylase n=1 Tax=Chitinasiproducens palmae TaxID=1770053 RepID=A0A1H2PR23_9BURK|nr:cupin domain-containing protein [Chitinasiproducens palmae]SDV49309.1 50S ribosomal protein L16 3-hydroxylase [Chitinasiproducens palmae]